MKPLSIRRSNQTIAVLLFTAVSILPIYSQEAQQSDKAQVVQSSEAQASEIINTKSPEKARSIRKVGSSRPGTDQSTTRGYTFPTKRERFNRYVKSTVGPVSLAGSGVSAGIDQWGDHPVEWGQGAAGYGKRYASRVGRTAIQQTVTYGLDAALRLDTGFKRSDRTGVFPRMKDALAGYITSRTRSGKRVISVPRLAAAYAGGIIPAETWYPSRYSYKDGLRMGTHSLVTGFGIDPLCLRCLSFALSSTTVAAQLSRRQTFHKKIPHTVDLVFPCSISFHEERLDNAKSTRMQQ